MNRSLSLIALCLLAAGCDCRSNQRPGECASDEADDTEVAGDSCEALESSALTLLEQRCGSCHANGSAEGGFDYLLDPSKLVANDKVRSGDPEGSTVYLRVESGSMPPYGEPLSADELQTVADWIACGVSEEGPERAFIDNDTVFGWMADDLREVEDRERIYVRYISLVHLWNAGVSEGRLDTYRAGLTKLLNHLSWMPQIENPTAVDSDALLYRIDLRDYRWQARDDDPVEAWESIVALDPYGFAYDDPDFEFVVENTRSRQPVLHGDWLVAAAAVPPLYHRILDIPDTQAEFLALFGVDQEQNVIDLAVQRAGFLQSGVSENNRIIERHSASYGYCWVSYDFASNGGDQNIFSEPLDFQADGGEVICGLPNRLQVYLLANAEGERLDIGPREIVFDKAHDREVVNGLGCMTCHTSGILPKDDQVRPAVEANEQLFSRNEREIIYMLYPDNEEIRSRQAIDQATFLEALDQTGAPRANETEQVFALSESFRDNLDLARAAAEVGLTPLQLQALSPELNEDVSRELNTLFSPGGQVQRDVFLLLVREIVCNVEDQINADQSCLELEGACGASGVPCLDGQACIEEGDDAGACVECSFDTDAPGCAEE